jgi:flagellar biosynthesis protein FliP
MTKASKTLRTVAFGSLRQRTYLSAISFWGGKGGFVACAMQALASRVLHGMRVVFFAGLTVLMSNSHVTWQCLVAALVILPWRICVLVATTAFAVWVSTRSHIMGLPVVARLQALARSGSMMTDTAFRRPWVFKVLVSGRDQAPCSCIVGSGCKNLSNCAAMTSGRWLHLEPALLSRAGHDVARAGTGRPPRAPRSPDTTRSLPEAWPGWREYACAANQAARRHEEVERGWHTPLAARLPGLRRTQPSARSPAQAPSQNRWRAIVLPAIVTLLALSLPGAAQDTALDSLAQGLTGGEGSLAMRSVQLIVLLTLLSLVPGILVTVTCFPFIVTVLAILRQALGLMQSPPNMLIVSLSLFLTWFVMEPVLLEAWQQGVIPLNDGRIGLEEGFVRILEPFRLFMAARVDLATFDSLARLRGGAEVATLSPDAPLSILTPAFMLSEIARAFQIGFLIFLPFLIIDLVVAAVLMSMGMMMVPPAIVSLPFKLSFFVVADGWRLLSEALVRSYM